MRATCGPLAPAVPFNAMFSHARCLPALQAERSPLERFDLYLFDVMNAPRLRGQIVFEYGTLLRAIDRWKGLSVLDVGTGRSTFPRWMSREGAVGHHVRSVGKPAEQSWRRLSRTGERRASRLRPRSCIRRSSARCAGCRSPIASFDLVTSLSVVEHLDTDLPERHLRAVRRTAAASRRRCSTR